MRMAQWVQKMPAAHLHWGLYLWVALLPFQLPLEHVLGFRLALSDVALVGTLSVGLVCWLFGTYSSRQRSAWRTNLDGYLVALVVVFVMALGVAWARTGRLTAYALVNKGAGIVALIAAYYMAVVLVSSARRLRHMTLVLLGSVGIANAASLVLYGIWLRYGIWTSAVSGERLAGFLIDPNANGGLLVVALLVQLGLLIGGRVRPRLARAAMAANSLLLSAGLVLTRSRSAWMALAAGGVVLLWLARRQLTWRRIAASATAVACLGGLLWLFAGDAIARLLKEALQPTSIGFRWEQVTGGLSYFPSSPIWGIGLNTFRELGSIYIIHNTYVWFLVEMGIIGFAVLLFLLFRVGRNWAAALRIKDRDWGLAVGGAAAFAAMLVLAVGIEALYQRPLWLLFAFAVLLRQKALLNQSAPSTTLAEPPEAKRSDTPAAS